MQRLFLLFLFSASSAQAFRVLILVFSVRSETVILHHVLCIPHTAFRLSEAGAKAVHVPADETDSQLHMFNFAREGRLTSIDSLHQGIKV